MAGEQGRTAADDMAALVQDAARRGVMGLLGIEVAELRKDRVELRLTVDERVHQPFGILHGGISALLAETAASFGASLAAPEGQRVVGIELNASHLRPMSEGVLTAVATPVRAGRSVQVWEITLTDDTGREICRSRCTLAGAPAGRPGDGSRDAGGGTGPVPAGST